MSAFRTKCNCGSDELSNVTSVADAAIGNRWLCRVCGSTFLAPYDDSDFPTPYDWRDALFGNKN